MPGVENCLQEAMAIPGAVGASIVDYTTGFPVATTGAAPNQDHEAAAAGTAHVVQAARELFGNTGPAVPVADVWPMQHPVAYTLLWVVGLLAVFVPLSIRAYKRAASR